MLAGEAVEEGAEVVDGRAHYTHLSRALYVCSTDLWTGSVGEDVQRSGEH